MHKLAEIKEAERKPAAEEECRQHAEEEECWQHAEEEEARRCEQEHEELEQRRVEEVHQHEQERRKEEAHTESERRHSQVRAEAVWRWVVIEVLAMDILEFWELAGTPDVDQEVDSSRDKGKGPESALESTGGQESQKCDSCKRWGVECVRPKVHSSQYSQN